MVQNRSVLHQGINPLPTRGHRARVARMDKASLIYVAGVIPLGAATIAFAGAGWWLAAIATGVVAAALFFWARRAVAERGLQEDRGPEA